METGGKDLGSRSPGGKAGAEGRDGRQKGSEQGPGYLQAGSAQGDTYFSVPVTSASLLSLEHTHPFPLRGLVPLCLLQAHCPLELLTYLPLLSTWGLSKVLASWQGHSHRSLDLQGIISIVCEGCVLAELLAVMKQHRVLQSRPAVGSLPLGSSYSFTGPSHGHLTSTLTTLCVHLTDE